MSRWVRFGRFWISVDRIWFGFGYVDHGRVGSEPIRFEFAWGWSVPWVEGSDEVEMSRNL